MCLIQMMVNAQTSQSDNLKMNNILDRHFVSLSTGWKFKLSTSSTDSLIWYSSDSNIVSVRNSVLKAKALGNTNIIVKNIEGDLVDTCSVTVAPWVAGVTNLQAEPILPNLKLLAIRNDTLYLQGQGGQYGWSADYIYTEGMNIPTRICNFLNDNSFPYDPESVLPTPFGVFVLAKRESLNAPRKIYKINISGEELKLVYDKFPPFPLEPNKSRIMQQGWDYDDRGNIYLGEYTDDNHKSYQVRIFKASNLGENWQDVYVFPPSSIHGYSGGIRHIHACQVDPFTGDIWIGTGDGNSQSRIYYHKNLLLPDSTGKVNLNLIGIGSQEYRVVSFAFSKKFIYWFMDAPCDTQKIFRIRRAKDYYTLTPSTSNDSDYRALVGVFADKPFRNSITVRDENNSTILVANEFENAALYGCDFRELDNLDRLIGIRENANGSMQIQEIYQSPALFRYAEILPVGTDSKGYVYFNSSCNSSVNRLQIFKAKFKWNDIDKAYASTLDSVIDPPNTKIKLFGNFQSPMEVFSARIDSIAFSGKLPDSVGSISSFYWNVVLHSDSFNSGRISAKISDLQGFNLEDSLTWLGRSDPGDDWINIGGMIDGENLISTQLFSTLSEFAIGSYSGIMDVESINLPTQFFLYQNYPNPFNNTTSISFDIPVNVIASIKIYDILGRKISELEPRRFERGHQNWTWDASTAASGVYFYRLEAINIADPSKNFTQVKKMVLMK